VFEYIHVKVSWPINLRVKINFKIKSFFFFEEVKMEYITKSKSSSWHKVTQSVPGKKTKTQTFVQRKGKVTKTEKEKVLANAQHSERTKPLNMIVKGEISNFCLQPQKR